MKKLTILLFLALGLIGLNSCSSDEDEKSLQLTDVGLKISLSDLTKSDDGQAFPISQSCVSPDEIEALDEDGNYLYHLAINYSINGVPQTEKDGVAFKAENNVLYTDLVKVPAGSVISIDKVALHDAAHNALYSTASKNATDEILTYVEKALTTPIELTVSNQTKQYIQIFLICAVKYTGDQLGYFGVELDAAKVFCFDYAINICGDPCDEEATNQHHVGIGSFDITPVIDGIVKTSYKSKDGVDGAWNSVCFTDYRAKDEIYKTKLTIKVDGIDKLLLSKDFTMAELLELEELATEYNHLLHFVICPENWPAKGGTVVANLVAGDNDEIILGEVEFKIEDICCDECPDLECLGFAVFEDGATAVYPINGWTYTGAEGIVASTIENIKYVNIPVTSMESSMVWQSPVFKYSKCDKIEINAFVKNISQGGKKNTKSGDGEAVHTYCIKVLMTGENGKTEEKEAKVSDNIEILNTLTFDFCEIPSGCASVKVTIIPTGTMRAKERCAFESFDFGISSICFIKSDCNPK
ncbi:MAG: hypothetical protein Q4F97_12310 [Bacteroidales bacterium]|nr:hypothetical protein [Bacteroidales bacterium]